MGSSIRRQLWETASGLIAGGGLGLLFELLRPLFDSRRLLLRLGAELFYLPAAFVWIFLAGQLGGRGPTPLYLFVCAAGWLAIHALSALLRRAAAGRKQSK